MRGSWEKLVEILDSTSYNLKPGRTCREDHRPRRSVSLYELLLPTVKGLKVKICWLKVSKAKCTKTSDNDHVVKMTTSSSRGKTGPCLSSCTKISAGFILSGKYFSSHN